MHGHDMNLKENSLKEEIYDGLLYARAYQFPKARGRFATAR
jgi:hypothetical protein